MVNGLIWVIYAVVIVFELRLLIQKSNLEYYHPLTQNVMRITDPINNLPPFRTLKMGGLPLGGIIVAFAITVGFWILMFGGHIGLSLIISVMTMVKCFGYMIIGLMIAQALTSWLPSTQAWSFAFGKLTEPIVNPVRRIIPPIGMIDISLMVVMFLIWILNTVIVKTLFAINITLGQMWAFL